MGGEPGGRSSRTESESCHGVKMFEQRRQRRHAQDNGATNPLKASEELKPFELSPVRNRVQLLGLKTSFEMF